MIQKNNACARKTFNIMQIMVQYTHLAAHGNYLDMDMVRNVIDII